MSVINDECVSLETYLWRTDTITNMISHTDNISALLLYVLCNTLVAQLNSQQDTTFANSWGPHRPHRHAPVQLTSRYNTIPSNRYWCSSIMLPNYMWEINVSITIRPLKISIFNLTNLRMKSTRIRYSRRYKLKRVYVGSVRRSPK